jgi:hypothetical protein
MEHNSTYIRLMPKLHYFCLKIQRKTKFNVFIVLLLFNGSINSAILIVHFFVTLQHSPFPVIIKLEGKNFISQKFISLKT